MVDKIKLWTVVCIAALAACFGQVHAVASEGNFQQLACDISNHGVMIETADLTSSQRDRVAKRRFIFDEVGITFSVKPFDYAKGYKQIDHILFSSSSRNRSGVMSIYVKDEGGYVEEVGTVDEACWIAFKQFVDLNKIPLSLQEVTDVKHDKQ